MLEPFDAHAALFRSWRVIRYERESVITNIQDLLQFIQNWMDRQAK